MGLRRYAKSVDAAPKALGLIPDAAIAQAVTSQSRRLSRGHVARGP